MQLRNRKERTIDFNKELPRKTIFDYLISPNNSSRELLRASYICKHKEHKGKADISNDDKEKLPNLPLSFSYDNAHFKKGINRAMRFSRYTWRKNSMPKQRPSGSMREHCSFVSNINTKGCFEFNKMKTNSHMPLSKTTNGPTIGMYNPNYSSIYEHSPKVTFGFKKQKKFNKQFLIKKLW